jgi:VWFA-related protein
MVQRFVPLALALTLALAQTPASRPQAPADATAQPEDVIRITVNLVQVDAVVIDAEGRLVDDLKAADFEIRQDGKQQVITNFSYINTRPGQSTIRTAVVSSGKKNANNPAAPPPVPLRTDQVRRTFALVVDDLALAAENVPAVRTALGKFVDQDMQPGDLAAVITTGTGMGALQQFTTDKRLLHTAIDHIKYNSFGRVGPSSFPAIGSGGGGSRTLNAERRSILNAGSLGAITNIVNGLRDLPGRKTVVLFSEDLHLLAGGQVDPRAQEQLDRLTDAAGRAAVVISSIDPRGLQTLQLSAADSPRNPARAGNIPMQRATQMFYSQDGMVRLAEATGGTFAHDNNDIAGALHRVVEDSNGYYLIGYHPAAATFDQKTGRPLFHKVTVHVKRAGLTVRSRTGFLGHPDAGHRTRSLTPQAELMHAMSSPFAAGGVHVRLTALFSNDAKNGSYIDALLHIDANDLKFEDAPDDRHKAQIDLLSATINENGQLEEPVEKVYTFTLNGDQYKAALRSGLLYRLFHAVKKPGGYQMRVALRDSGTLRIGTASQYIEVPDLSKGRLALSSIEMEDATGALPADGQQSAEGQVRRDNPLGSPAVRSFQPGAQVLYAYQLFNAHLDANKKPQLEMETRIFRDGESIYQSAPRAVEGRELGDPAHLLSVGELRMGPTMKPGDYVLQIIVTDKLADEKYRVASQWMDFEVRQ